MSDDETTVHFKVFSFDQISGNNTPEPTAMVRIRVPGETFAPRLVHREYLVFQGPEQRPDLLRQIHGVNPVVIDMPTALSHGQPVLVTVHYTPFVEELPIAVLKAVFLCVSEFPPQQQDAIRRLWLQEKEKGNLH